MGIDIQNKSLLRNVKMRLIVENKTKLEELEELSLTNKNFLKLEQEIDLTEITKIKNLKKLSIKFFSITNEVIECLNNLEFLETLEIFMCKFETDKVLNGNISNLYIYNAENFKLNLINLKKVNIIRIEKSGLIDFSEFIKFENLCRLEVIDCPVISIPKIDKLCRIEKLYLEQIDLQFDLEIRNLEKLDFISLNGSKVKNKEEYIEKIKLQKNDIKIEFKDNNRPIQ